MASALAGNLQPLGSCAVFMKKGHIESGEYLRQTTDEARIAEVEGLFELKGGKRGAEGFEIWDGGRIVCRYPDQNTQL